MKYTLKQGCLLTVIDPNNNHYNRPFDIGHEFTLSYRLKDDGALVLTDGEFDVFVMEDAFKELFECKKKDPVIFKDAKWRGDNAE